MAEESRTLTVPTLVNGLAPTTPVKAPSESEFGRDFYMPAESLETIGAGLIRKAGTGLADVLEAEVDIAYLWRKKSAKRRGVEQGASLKRAGGMAGYFAKADFVLEVSAEYVREHQLTHFQLEALIYSSLSAIRVEMLEEGEIRLSLRPADFEGFYGEVARYGNWRADLARAAETLSQAPLFSLTPKPASAAAAKNADTSSEALRGAESDADSDPPPTQAQTARRRAGAASVNAAAASAG